MLRTALLSLLMMSALSALAFTPPVDRAEAEALCKEAALADFEGIWHYPEIRSDVLIMRDEADPSRAGIWIVESENTYLAPGTRLGTLRRSADSNKFYLSLFTSIKKGMLVNPRECAATFSSKNESIVIEKRKFKFSFNPFGMLPYSIRRAFRITEINPASKLPDGMYRLFPSYDGNGSSRRSIRYL